MEDDDGSGMLVAQRLAKKKTDEEKASKKKAAANVKRVIPFLMFFLFLPCYHPPLQVAWWVSELQRLLERSGTTCNLRCIMCCLCVMK
jgi:hypothetical protein